MKSLRLVVAGLLTVFFAFSITSAVSAVTGSTTINSVISPVISINSTSGTVTVSVTPTGAGAQTISTDTVSVSTNDSSGYTLTLSTATATTGLISGSNTIPASAGTQSVPVTPQVVNTWGYGVPSVGGFNSSYSTASSAAISGALKFAGVPASTSPNTIKTTSGSATNDTTNIYYAVAADTTLATGTYTQSVTYTATAN